MPTLTVTKTYDSGNILTETDLDNIKNSLETFLNTTKLDGDNLQTGGVPTASLADSAVTSAKIASGAVTSAKLDTNIAVSGTLGVTGATTLSTLATTGNVQVGDATTDTLTLGGSSGIVFTNVTTANKTGVSIDSTDDNFYPGGTSKAAVKAIGTKTLATYDPTADTTYPIVTSADPGSSNSLKIVRGRVDADGTKITGEGFTSSKSATGRYAISFTTAFSAEPVATACLYFNAGQLFTQVISQSTTALDIATYNSSGVATDERFNFIAIGPR
jgi:hypothetical protein